MFNVHDKHILIEDLHNLDTCEALYRFYYVSVRTTFSFGNSVTVAEIQGWTFFSILYLFIIHNLIQHLYYNSL